MIINNYFKGLCCTFFLLLSNAVFADWATIDDDISISSSKARYVRGQNAYIVQIKITNNGSEELTGPFRMLIEDSTLPVKDQDGTTDTNVPYFDLIPTKLAPNSSKSVTARFEYERRTNLTFSTSFQSNPPAADTDNDGVFDDVDQCPDTPADTDVNSNGCALAQLDSDNDGVSDELDQCPDTGADAAVDANGCSLIPPTTENGLPIINFELGGTGADFAWNVFENTDNPIVQLVANPNISDTNASTTVAMFTARQTGAPWAGVETAHGDIGPMTLDATNSIIKIMVYKTIISDVGLKLAIANGGAQPEIKVANTLINQWEELTFDFSENIGLFESINVDQIIVFPDFDFARSQENIVYFDNITFNGNGDNTDTDTEGELLINGTFDNGSEGWNGGAVITEGDNNIFSAEVAAPGNPWDVNLNQVMTLIPDATYILSFKAKASVTRTIIAGLGLAHDPWTNTTETVALSTEWQSFTYTLTTSGFGDDNSRVLFDMGAEAGTVYLDDISVTIQGDDSGTDGDTGGDTDSITTINFEAGDTGATYTWNVFENTDNPAVEIVANPDSTGVNTSATVAMFTARSDAAPWAGTESAHGDFGPMTLDATNSIVKIMVYKTVISDVGIKFAIANGGAQPEIKVANTLVNQWEELSFDFSGQIGTFESINIDQIIVFPDFDFARSQENVIYFDNISFSDGSDSDGSGDGDTGGGDTDTDSEGELLNNGTFDNGTEGWNGGAVITEGDNNIFSAEVAAPGNPWDVNLNQVMTLIPDATYILSFKAKASVTRTIIAGLGLAHDPWTNTTETVALSTEWQSFTYTLTTSGFGDDNSRVLFDMGAEAGTVYLDDISVTIQGDDSGTGGGDTGGTEPSADWSMVWSDEFDGENIDLSKWEHEVNCDGGGNNEKQCYTSNPENSFVDSGLLKIVAKPESGQAQPYSSARLRTKYQGDWKYGRIEVRAKPPQGQGSFPAIWMLPTDNVYGGWPHSGEIDIYESVNLKTVNDQGVEEAGVHGNLWYGSSWPNQSNSGAHTELPNDQNPADGFHTYAIEWEEGEMRWYVDDVLYQTQTKSTVNIDSDGDANGLTHRGWFADYDGEDHWDNAPFDQRFHLILNFAVGGTWSEVVNNGGIDASAFGENNAFEFDYVRVYECSVNPSTGQGCATTHDGYIAPVDEGGTLVEGAAPIPVKPSTGIATDLIVFENTSNDEWPAWSSNDETTAAIVNDDIVHDQVVEFSMGSAAAVAGFNNASANIPAPYDGSPMLNNGWLEFDMKLVTPPNNASANWNLKVEQGGASSEATIQLATPTAQWQHYAVSLLDLNNAGLDLNGIDVIMIFPDWGQGEGAVFRVDNMTILAGEETGGDSGGDDSDTDTGPVPGEEILSNGSFEESTTGWIGAVTVNSDGDNSFFQADVAVAGNPWDVNLSQIMTLIPGESYVLSFNAKASLARSIIAGLGLNHEPWTNVTETVALTTQWQNYTYVLTATGFGDDNSRVLFDLGAEAGSVFIDDVSVSIQENTDSDAGDPDNDSPVVGDQFVIVSSTGNTDVELTPDTIGEWSTGTVIQAGVTFDGLMSWELTSSANSPEQGNWGTVLAFQNGIVGDFSLFNRIELTLATSGGYAGGFKIAISGNGVSKEISLPVDQSSATWQTVSIDTADIPVNMSSIDWIAIYGIGGQIGVSTIHVTDFRLVKDGTIAFDNETEGDYVFISSDADIASDLIVDDNNNSAAGNIIFGEWSTGTTISDINYSGLDAIQLSAGGSWGAVLALQGDISDGVNIDNYDVDVSSYTNIKFKVASQGAFERYALSIVSKVGNNETAQEVGFSLANQADWNNIDIDLAYYGVDLSNVSQMAVFGVYAGGSASQKIYITDMILYDTGKVTPAKDSSDDKFVFFSSSGESSDMIFDGDDSAHNGNTTIGEWSTGTTLTSDVTYNGLTAFELTKGAGWGAVLALMGDIYGGVQEYKLDVAQYSTINFKIAAQGAFSAYFIDFIVDGAEFKVPVTVNSNWTDVTINVADLPLNLSKLTQIAIFGEGGGVGNKIYITDLNISK